MKYVVEFFAEKDSMNILSFARRMVSIKGKRYIPLTVAVVDNSQCLVTTEVDNDGLEFYVFKTYTNEIVLTIPNTYGGGLNASIIQHNKWVGNPKIVSVCEVNNG